MGADLCIGVDDRARSDEYAEGDRCALGDDRRRVNNGHGELNAIELIDEQLSALEIADRKDWLALGLVGDFVECAGVGWAVACFGDRRICEIIDEALDVDFGGVCCIEDDFGVPAAADEDDVWSVHSVVIGSF